MTTVDIAIGHRPSLGTTDAPLCMLDGRARIGALCTAGAHMTTAMTRMGEEYCIHCGELTLAIVYTTQDDEAIVKWDTIDALNLAEAKGWWKEELVREENDEFAHVEYTA